MSSTPVKLCPSPSWAASVLPRPQCCTGRWQSRWRCGRSSVPSSSASRVPASYNSCSSSRRLALWPPCSSPPRRTVQDTPSGRRRHSPAARAQAQGHMVLGAWAWHGAAGGAQRRVRRGRTPHVPVGSAALRVVVPIHFTLDCAFALLIPLHLYKFASIIDVNLDSSPTDLTSSTAIHRRTAKLNFTCLLQLRSISHDSTRLSLRNASSRCRTSHGAGTCSSLTPAHSKRLAAMSSLSLTCSRSSWLIVTTTVAWGGQSRRAVTTSSWADEPALRGRRTATPWLACFADVAGR